MMENLIFITYIGLALFFLIYNVISYKKKNIIYTIRKGNISVIKDDYYNIQLIFSIFNCILLILGTVFIYNKIDVPLFVALYIGVYWLVNYLLKFIAIKMNYLNTSYE